MLNNQEQISTNQTGCFIGISRNGSDLDLSQLNEVESQEPRPKRKKCVVRKQSRSLKYPTEGLKASILPAPKNCEVATQEYREQTASKPITSMDTPKHCKGKESSYFQGSKMKQNSLFLNASIIKFSAPKVKEPVQVFPAQVIAQQTQFTTTEQQLSLSKSTLERLAAFRYKPQNNGQSSTIEITSTEFDRTENHLSPNYLENFDEPNISSCDRTCFNGKDFIEKIVETSTLEGELDPTDIQSARCEQYIDYQEESKGSQKTDLSNEIDIEISKVSTNIYHYDLDLQNSCSSQVLESHPEVKGPNHTIEKANNILPCLATGIEESTHFQGYEASKFYSGPLPQRDGTSDSLGVPSLCLPEITCQSPILERCCDRVQVEQSDAGDYEMMSNHVSKDLYANHIFDEGLDDNYFIEISLESSKPMALPKRVYGTRVRSQQPHIPQVAVEAHNNQQINESVLLTPNGSRDQDDNREYLTSNTAISQTVDEFPIDKEDEKEFLKLANTAEDADIFMVTERFAPPTSVQGAMCIRTEGSEVYDSSLQFSPLKLQG